MSAKIVGLAAALFIVLGAAWWLGSRAPSEQAPAPDRSKVARSEPTPEPMRAPKSEANGGAVAKPATPPPAPVAQDRRAEEDSRVYEYIDRLFAPPGPGASEAERLAWEQSEISGYIYPAGHPCEGLPNERASVEALLQAVARPEYFEQFPEVDRPQVVLEGHKDFFPLNRCANGLNREDPASVELFISCFNSLPENPAAYPATVWLPVSADHPGATTMRAHMTQVIRSRAERLMAGPACNL
jgi:hypothetical protein